MPKGLPRTKEQIRIEELAADIVKTAKGIMVNDTSKDELEVLKSGVRKTIRTLKTVRDNCSLAMDMLTALVGAEEATGGQQEQQETLIEAGTTVDSTFQPYDATSRGTNIITDEELERGGN